MGVQGRQEDMLVLPGKGDQPVQVHPNVFHDAMDVIPNNGWQVVQEPDGLRVLVVPDADNVDAARVQGQIGAALAQQHVATVAVRVERVAAIPKAPSGKSPLIRALSAQEISAL